MRLLLGLLALLANYYEPPLGIKLLELPGDNLLVRFAYLEDILLIFAAPLLWSSLLFFIA